MRSLALACLLACGCASGIDGDLRPEDLVLPTGEAPPMPALPDGLRVRAMTYNIHGGQEASAEAIGALIASLSPTWVAIVECPDAYAEPLAAASGLAHHAYQDGKLILSRTPLSEVRQIAFESRSVLHAVTELEGVRFSLYAVHIGWNAAGARQARMFVDELMRDPLPHLLAMGDYNDEHGSVQIGILEEVIEDAFTALGWYPGERISWPSTGFDGSEGSQLIDLFFFRKALRPIVIAGDVLNLAPVLSDHKPVWTDLLYPRAEPFTSDPFAGTRGQARVLPPSLPANLLDNPGAEDGMRGWTVEGDGASAVAERLHQRPRTGAAFFTGGERLGERFSSSASQVVSLADHAAEIDARRGELLVSGWMATGYEVEVDGDVTANRPRPYDDAEVIVSALDGSGSVMTTWTSRRRDTLSWMQLAAAIPLPPGARQARLTWVAHRKEASGPGADGAIDDLYLGFSARASPHALLGGDLIGDAWQLSGWRKENSGASVGVMLYPPWSFSGPDYFYAGGVIGLEERAPGPSSMSQEVGVSPFADQSVRWSAALRTWSGEGHVWLALEIIDEEGLVWGALESPKVSAAEWTRVEMRTRVPRGAARVRLSVHADGPTPLSAAFADLVSLVPEAR